VTEAEWLACDDPDRMLGQLRGRAGTRKLRLFGVACCRRALPWVYDDRIREAVEVAGRYADGWATDEELARAHRAAADAWEEADYAGSDAARLVTSGDPAEACVSARHAPGNTYAGGESATPDGWAALEAEMAAQAALLRCLFGNPFRPAPRLDPAWLAWGGGTVRALAEAIYEGRAFDRMPVLADALEDAGCSDADLLGHCRQGRAREGVRWSAEEYQRIRWALDPLHGRGCRALDLLLGKG
jgi:hypothetical protein